MSKEDKYEHLSQYSAVLKRAEDNGDQDTIDVINALRTTLEKSVVAQGFEEGMYDDEAIGPLASMMFFAFDKYDESKAA